MHRIVAMISCEMHQQQKERDVHTIYLLSQSLLISAATDDGRIDEKQTTACAPSQRGVGMVASS